MTVARTTDFRALEHFAYYLMTSVNWYIVYIIALDTLCMQLNQ